MHTCSLKSPVRPCALVSLEAKQKLCAVLPPRGVARIKRQDLQKAGRHRGETPAYAQMPLCELCSLGFGWNSKWACYATCCGSYSGSCQCTQGRELKRTQLPLLILDKHFSAWPSTVQILPLTGFKSPHAHSAGAISSRWAAAVCNTA